MSKDFMCQANDVQGCEGSSPAALQTGDSGDAIQYWFSLGVMFSYALRSENHVLSHEIQTEYLNARRGSSA